jgi:hypothetical protein
MLAMHESLHICRGISEEQPDLVGKIRIAAKL